MSGDIRPDVSILLLTRNGIGTLPAVLDALASQVAGFGFEIVAIDSGSNDGTVELLSSRVDTLVQISPLDFNHGLTRNFGITHCRGEAVVLLVQDAEPASAGWLAALVAPLLSDSRLAGTFGRQMPRSDASAVTRHYLAQWVAAGRESKTSFVATAEEFGRLSPMDRFLSCVFDNVCSCIRRSVWETIPFRKVPIAEDLEWGRDVLLAGYGLAYVPEASVVHSHDRPASYELGRTYLVHQRLRSLFGVATIPDLPSLARAVATSTFVHVKCATEAGAGAFVRELPRALALAVALPLGQYLGLRSADTRREWLRPKGI
jgi:rhamnosyltransferase